MRELVDINRKERKGVTHGISRIVFAPKRNSNVLNRFPLVFALVQLILLIFFFNVLYFHSFSSFGSTLSQSPLFLTHFAFKHYYFSSMTDLEFSNVFLENMGVLIPGTLKFDGTSAVFKSDKKIVKVQVSDIKGIRWQKLGNKPGIRFALQDGSSQRMGGFKDSVRLN